MNLLTIAILYHPSTTLAPQIVATLKDRDTLLAVAEKALAQVRGDPEEERRLRGAFLVLLPELIVQMAKSDQPVM